MGCCPLSTTGSFHAFYPVTWLVRLVHLQDHLLPITLHGFPSVGFFFIGLSLVAFITRFRFGYGRFAFGLRFSLHFTLRCCVYALRLRLVATAPALDYRSLVWIPHPRFGLPVYRSVALQLFPFITFDSYRLRCHRSVAHPFGFTRSLPGLRSCRCCRLLLRCLRLVPLLGSLTAQVPFTVTRFWFPPFWFRFAVPTVRYRITWFAARWLRPTRSAFGFTHVPVCSPVTRWIAFYIYPFWFGYPFGLRVSYTVCPFVCRI